MLLAFSCVGAVPSTLQKSAKLVKMRHHILFYHFPTLWNIYIYVYKHYFSIVLDPSKFCTAFFQEVGANPL